MSIRIEGMAGSFFRSWEQGCWRILTQLRSSLWGKLSVPVRRLTSTLMMMLGPSWSMLTGARVTGTGFGARRWTVKRARKGAALLVDPWTHLKIAKVLGRREIRPVVEAAPRMIFKYLTGYLKDGLSRKERASILVHHYTLLGNHAHEHFFRTIVDGRLELWRELVGGRAYRIFLTFPRETHDEGDLALIFRADATDLYTLSFTLGPGIVAGLRAKNVMYIARVQGKGGALDLIRSATKSCLDISPTALLLSAAEGIAMELNLEQIVGISGSTQISAGKSPPGGLVTAYDDFWIAFGGQKLDGDMYRLTVPLAEKPLQLIKRCHRSRVRRKRAFRRLVSETVRASFRESVVRRAAG